MIAEGICKYINGMNYQKSIYPKLTEVVDKVVEEWNDKDK
jgi:hypothetical protein